MKDLRDIIAKNISALRLGRGLTQGNLAEILNYSDKAVSKWERGESVPDIAVLKQIADYFGVSVDYLLQEKHECEAPDEYGKDIKRRNRRHLIIGGLSVSLVWLIASVVFVALILFVETLPIPPFCVYIYALPTSGVVALVFNTLWGRGKMNFPIISFVLWATLLSVYLSFLFCGHNLWLVFIIGIPAQLIILLWSGLSRGK